MSRLNEWALAAVQGADKKVVWPDEYVNRKTGKVYKPQHDEIKSYIYDTPTKSYVYVMAGEGCVSANTLIDNHVPVAEWQGGYVNTLNSRQLTSKSYLKGQADLYSVNLQNANNVSVTLDHKFLTNVGWLPLKSITQDHLITTQLHGINTLTNISSIGFDRYGDYYDLSVPIGENYLANGIIHHNSGKTATLGVMIAEKMRRGLDSALVCVDLPMLLKAWNEIRLWLDPTTVVPEHRYMLGDSWSPYKAYFEIMFVSPTGLKPKLVVGGLGTDYNKWESLSLNSFFIEEAKSIPSEKIMKVATGRIRITGPNDEIPQIIIGSTPSDMYSHWLFKYFGNLDPIDSEDPLYKFKQKAVVVKLTVKDNVENLYKGYIEDRALTLTEAEKKMFVDGDWGDLSDSTRFVEHISIWTKLYDKRITAPRKKDDLQKDWSDSIVIALDGAIKNDSFAMVGVSRNPNNRSDVAVRLTHEFKPINGRIDFQAVESKIREWCLTYNVVTVVFDIYQIYDMTERLRKEGIAWFQEFSQQNKRTLADNQLYELILQSRIAHMGQSDLEEHVRNAGYKYDAKEMKRRIVKIQRSKKVDLLVCTAMASYECLRLML